MIESGAAVSCVGSRSTLLAVCPLLWKCGWQWSMVAMPLCAVKQLLLPTTYQSWVAVHRRFGWSETVVWENITVMHPDTSLLFFFESWSSWQSFQDLFLLNLRIRFLKCIELWHPFSFLRLPCWLICYHGRWCSENFTNQSYGFGCYSCSCRECFKPLGISIFFFIPSFLSKSTVLNLS